MNPNQIPLYEVLDKYFPEIMEMLVPGMTKTTIGDMAEDLANWLVPEEPEPPLGTGEPWPQAYQLMSDSKWEQRQLLRQILLDEAKKAREKSCL